MLCAASCYIAPRYIESLWRPIPHKIRTQERSPAATRVKFTSLYHLGVLPAAVLPKHLWGWGWVGGTVSEGWVGGWCWGWGRGWWWWWWWWWWCELFKSQKICFLTACAGYLLYVPFKTNNKTNIDQIDTRHHHGPQSFMSFTSGILCRVSKFVSLTTIRTIYIVTYTSNMCKRYSCLDSRHNSQIMNMILSCQYDQQAAPTLI